MKILIVSLFYHPDMPSRTHMAYDYYCENYDAAILTADFVHPWKKHDKEPWSNCIKIHVPGYKTNMSLARIFSHFIYAVKIGKVLDKQKPDLVYICVPPNLSSLLAVRWAKRNHVKSIVDIIDIWPNINAPSNKIFALFYKAWIGIRDKAVEQANEIILECAIYKEHVKRANCTVIPLCREPAHILATDLHDALRILYLGAFSTSYDFQTLLRICTELTKMRNVELYLIGDGAEKAAFLESLVCAKINYTDYGIVYDDSKKEEIMSRCDFGYNGFKEGIVIGQSYKSLDYLASGLAVINNLKGELAEMVDEYSCGFNFQSDSIEELIEKMRGMTIADVSLMKHNSQKLFKEKLSWSVYMNSMDSVMQGLED